VRPARERERKNKNTPNSFALLLLGTTAERGEPAKTGRFEKPLGFK
jgi:hypothetical protein